jgi:transcription elongation factor GreA
MADKIFLSQEGLVLLQEEIKNLKEVRRGEVAEKLKEAISYGDISENSEYDDARNQQAQVEFRISEIEEILKNYEIIEDQHDSKQVRVSIGSEIAIKWLNEKQKGEKESFKIVGSTEADIFDKKDKKISNESPIGKALLGKKVGDIARGKAPFGEFEMEILKIS